MLNECLFACSVTIKWYDYCLNFTDCDIKLFFMNIHHLTGLWLQLSYWTVPFWIPAGDPLQYHTVQIFLLLLFLYVYNISLFKCNKFIPIVAEFYPSPIRTYVPWYIYSLYLRCAFPCAWDSQCAHPLWWAWTWCHIDCRPGPWWSRGQ